MQLKRIFIISMFAISGIFPSTVLGNSGASPSTPSSFEASIDAFTTEFGDFMSDTGDFVNEAYETVFESVPALEAELYLKEALLLSIKEARDFNEASGLNEYYISVPLALGVYFLMTRGGAAVNRTSQFLTSGMKKRASSFAEKMKMTYEAEKIAAENVKDFKEQNSKYLKQKKQWALDTLRERESRYYEAVGKRHLLQKTKRARLYKAGKVIKGAGLITFLFGEVLLAAAISGEAMLVWLPDQMSDDFVEDLESDVESLKKFLFFTTP